MKKYLLFGLIASVLSINAYAVSATVTSKDYVDTTRQATIPATGTNSATPGDTVVTYTSTAGTIGERGIYDGSDDYDSSTDADNLVTAGALLQVTDEILDTMPDLPTGTAGTVPVYNIHGELGSAERGIYDGSTTYNSSTDADKLVTAAALQDVQNSVENLPTIETSKMVCVDSPDCTLWSVVDQTVYGTCKAYGESANDAGECCSGVLSGGLCKCGTDSDCVASYGSGAFCSIGTCHADEDGK